MDFQSLSWYVKTSPLFAYSESANQRNQQQTCKKKPPKKSQNIYQSPQEGTLLITYWLLLSDFWSCLRSTLYVNLEEPNTDIKSSVYLISNFVRNKIKRLRL